MLILHVVLQDAIQREVHGANGDVVHNFLAVDFLLNLFGHLFLLFFVSLFLLLTFFGFHIFLHLNLDLHLLLDFHLLTVHLLVHLHLLISTKMIPDVWHKDHSAVHHSGGPLVVNLNELVPCLTWRQINAADLLAMAGCGLDKRLVICWVATVLGLRPRSANGHKTTVCLLCNQELDALRQMRLCDLLLLIFWLLLLHGAEQHHSGCHLRLGFGCFGFRFWHRQRQIGISMERDRAVQRNFQGLAGPVVRYLLKVGGQRQLWITVAHVCEPAFPLLIQEHAINCTSCWPRLLCRFLIWSLWGLSWLVGHGSRAAGR
mmetsp:Transcript_64727/g.107296  ORF Transcript_64727/g.107296 Transcript_64727/m.107296 type:complete len:316 (+) Transcript_64727:1153-2100(+)